MANIFFRFYLAHRIQQPNSKLRLINVHKLFHQSNVFDENTVTNKLVKLYLVIGKNVREDSRLVNLSDNN